jgi:uncharacterized protein YrrD
MVQALGALVGLEIYERRGGEVVDKIEDMVLN